jgi:hypothetical protein
VDNIRAFVSTAGKLIQVRVDYNAKCRELAESHFLSIIDSKAEH